MKKSLFIYLILTYCLITGVFAQNNLKYSRIIYVTPEAQQTVPKGCVWRIDAVVASEKYYNNLGKGLLGGMNGGDPVAQAKFDSKKISMNGVWFYPSDFPLWIDETTKIETQKFTILCATEFKIEP